MGCCVYYGVVWGVVGFVGDGLRGAEAGGVGVGDCVVGCY